MCGVMGMASLTTNEVQIRKEFKNLVHIFNLLKQACFYEEDHFKEISMGMSGDYLLAVEQGSTMGRVGSKIFGSR